MIDDRGQFLAGHIFVLGRCQISGRFDNCMHALYIRAIRTFYKKTVRLNRTVFSGVKRSSRYASDGGFAFVLILCPLRMHPIDRLLRLAGGPENEFLVVLQ